MQNRRYRAVIFDLDGTLLNTIEDLHDSVNYVLGKRELPLQTIEQVRRNVGNGIRKLMECSVDGGESYPSFDEMFSEFTKYYQEHSCMKTAPYDGILELTTSLKAGGYRLAIVSNKFQAGVDDLKQIFFSEDIEFAIGESEKILRKPAPDTALEALRLLNLDKKDAVYVGDSEVDVKTAANAGLDFIGVTWGFRSRETLTEAGATIMVDSPAELASILNCEL